MLTDNKKKKILYGSSVWKSMSRCLWDTTEGERKKEIIPNQCVLSITNTFKKTKQQCNR